MTTVHRWTAFSALILACLLHSGSSMAGNNGIVRFPGVLSSADAPNKRYAVYNVDYDDRTPHHEILLRNTNDNSSTKLMSYNRSIGVLWSPNSKAFFVNDHGGSDYTDCLVFVLNGGIKKTGLKDLLRQQHGANRSVFGNHHVYVEGTRWKDEHTIRLKVHGYGDVDPNGFAIYYSFRLKDGNLVPAKGP